MKNNFLWAFILLLGLALISGCKWLNNNKKTDNSELAGSYDSQIGHKSRVLVKFNGKPAITVNDFEDFWSDLIKAEPQAAALVEFMPNIREETFSNLLNDRLILQWLKNEKKDQDPEYRKKVETLNKQIERAIATQIFQEYLLNKIDQSNEAVEKFYNENKEKLDAFQQAPFTKTIGGTKAMGVNFNDEKEAREFYNKAQKPNANFIALAKNFKKDINNFGGQPINMQSRHANKAIKEKLADIKSLPSVVLIQTDRGSSFWVVKALARTKAEYLPFADVKDAAKQVMIQTKLPQMLEQEFEQFRKDYKIDESAAKAFFEEEGKRKELELQDKLRDTNKKNQNS